MGNRVVCFDKPAKMGLVNKKNKINIKTKERKIT